MLPASSSALNRSGAARIADVDPDAAALPEKQWQHRGNQQGRAPERHVPCRQVDAAHDDTRRAENGRRADGAGDTQQGGTLWRNRRFHRQANCEYGFDVPPSIDSLDLPPFKPRFPWWGRRPADPRGVARSLPGPTWRRTPASACAFRMADRSGDILLGMLDRPAEPQANRPLVILVHGLTGCENSVSCAERGAPSARSRLSRAAAERARLRRLARPIAASTTISAAPPISAACCRSCPTT